MCVKREREEEENEHYIIMSILSHTKPNKNLYAN
jgi:hypothetical protein